MKKVILMAAPNMFVQASRPREIAKFHLNLPALKSSKKR